MSIDLTQQALNALADAGLGETIAKQLTAKERNH